MPAVRISNSALLLAMLQIRKYMYQTCVHVDDLQGLCDTSGVQAYCINGKRAVLIHPKVMTPGQQCPVFDNTCRCAGRPASLSLAS